MSQDHISEESTERKYFSMILHIVHDIGLNSYLFHLYALMKRAAGENGHSTLSVATMASKLGCCENTIKKYKKQLEIPRAELGGKSLIKIKKRQAVAGDPESDEITLTDLWPENTAHIEKLRKEKERKNQEIKENLGGSPDAGGVGHQMPGGGSPDARKEQPPKKNFSEEQQQGPVVVLYRNFSKLLDRGQVSFDKLVALVKEFGLNRVKSALDYTEFQCGRKEVPSVGGYLMEAIKAGWSFSPGCEFKRFIATLTKKEIIHPSNPCRFLSIIADDKKMTFQSEHPVAPTYEYNAEGIEKAKMWLSQYGVKIPSFADVIY